MKVRDLQNREFEIFVSPDDDALEVYTNQGEWLKIEGRVVLPEYAKLRVQGRFIMELPGSNLPLTRAKIQQSAWGSFWEGPERAALTQLELLDTDKSRRVDINLPSTKGESQSLSILTNYQVSRSILSFMADSITKAFTLSAIQADEAQSAFSGVLVVPDAELGTEILADGSRRKVISLGIDPGGTLIITNSVARNPKVLSLILNECLERWRSYQAGILLIGHSGWARDFGQGKAVRQPRDDFERQVAPHGVIVADRARAVLGSDMEQFNGTVFLERSAVCPIVVDDKLDPDLRLLYKEFLGTLSELRHESPGTLRKILQAISVFVCARLTGSVMAEELVLKSDLLPKDNLHQAGFLTLMDFVRAGVGGEPHKALLAGYMIGSLVRRGVLQGKLSLEQNQEGAVWLRYLSAAGDVVIHDPEQGFVGELSGISEERFGYLRNEDLIRLLARPISA